MSTQSPALTRDALASIAERYFKAVSSKDLDGLMSLFAQDTVLIVQDNPVMKFYNKTFAGADVIREMFGDFMGGSVSVSQEITSLVADESNRKIAVELNYVGELANGHRNDMHNCYFFEVNPHGKIARAIMWMGLTDPEAAW